MSYDDRWDELSGLISVGDALIVDMRCQTKRCVGVQGEVEMSRFTIIVEVSWDKLHTLYTPQEIYEKMEARGTMLIEEAARLKKLHGWTT